jgi:cytochrome c oxidase subunit IV
MQQMKSDPSKTILTITLGFLVVYLIGEFQWALWTALVVGISGLFSGFIARFIEKAWMKLALILSYIVPNILMGVIFYAFLFPLSLLSKLFRKKDPMRLKQTGETMYTERTKSYTKADLENMW